MDSFDLFYNSLRILPEALYRSLLHFRCGAIHGQHCGGLESAQSVFLARETQPSGTSVQSQNTTGICKLPEFSNRCRGQFHRVFLIAPRWFFRAYG